MTIVRKRLLIWLLKAYLKKWGKGLFLSFLAGLLIFVMLITIGRYFSHLLPQRKERIGVVGAYQLNNLPYSFTSQLSRGLTKVDNNGIVRPDIAKSWKIEDGGKTYIFYLQENLTFSNGEKVTSDKINYKFEDVKVERPDDYTLIYKLKDAYSPFLVTVSRPIFRKGLVGIGKIKVTDIELNGEFISSLTIRSADKKVKNQTYIFYPNQEAVKMSFLLGETTKITDINDPIIHNSSLISYPNVKSTRQTNYNRLVTLFYNTSDSVLSETKLRRGLTFALPDSFEGGERAYLPYSPNSYYYNRDIEKPTQDLEHAKLLIDAVKNSASASGKLQITIKTLKRYRKDAQIIANSWKSIGIQTHIEEVSSVPESFQVYLGDFTIPKDPDQYVLWHSNQRYKTNITKLNNLRIDKLLEDGRKTIDIQKRKKIYDDFQRFLLEESPAAFLYFPTTYIIVRN